MKRKVKKYADGGTTTDFTQQPTYPFYSNQTQSSSQGGVNQTFNVQPQANAGTPPQYKKGGKVKSASERADGCAIRGKTRA
jgi:hypothetical protein